MRRFAYAVAAVAAYPLMPGSAAFVTMVAESVKGPANQLLVQSEKVTLLAR
jgi:hypothetical protein